MNPKAPTNAAQQARKRPRLEPLEPRLPLDGTIGWTDPGSTPFDPDTSAWVDPGFGDTFSFPLNDPGFDPSGFDPPIWVDPGSGGFDPPIWVDPGSGGFDPPIWVDPGSGGFDPPIWVDPGSGGFDPLPWIEPGSGGGIPFPGTDPGVGDPPVLVDPSVEQGFRVVGVLPAGSNLGSPAQITLVLSEPLAAGQFPVGTIVLERIEGDGSARLVEGTSGKPEQVSWDGLRLSLPLDQALAPGRYRVSFGADAVLHAESGGLILGSGFPKVLGQFEVLERPAGPYPNAPAEPAAEPLGPRLDDAVDLGLVGPSPIRVPGLLDASAPGSAVALYRVELAPGRSWRLGLEVQAQRDGSTLDAALALFDANGHLVAQALFARSDAPRDPFLFAGLQPGTYYIAVMPDGLQANLGGYDPVSGSVARPRGSASSGPFSLAVVADPIDAPTRLVSTRLDFADPASLAPTGLTLQFDGPMRASASRLRLVDASGQVWSARSTGYDEARGTLSFVFSQPMPAGVYTVMVDPDAPLLDLAGLPPTSPARGEGVLARVGLAGRAAAVAGDLGAVQPGAAESGVQTQLRVSRNGSASFRFVITEPGVYSVGLTGAAASVQLVEAGGRVLELSAGLDPFALNGATVELQPGVYRLMVSGAEPGTPMTLRLRVLVTLHDDLLHNGLGQGSAFGLRSIIPSSGGGDASSFPVPGGSRLDQPMLSPSDLPLAGDDSLATNVGLPASWIGGMIGRPSEPDAAGAASMVSQGGSGPGSLSPSGIPISPAQGGLAMASETGSFWSIDAAPGPIGSDSPSSASLPVVPSKDVAVAVLTGEPMAEPSRATASLSTDDVLAMLEAALPADARSAAGQGDAEAETYETIQVGDYRLGVGVALVAAWAIRRRIRRQKSKARASLVVPASGWSYPSGQRWSFPRSRSYQPRPRLT